MLFDVCLIVLNAADLKARRVNALCKDGARQPEHEIAKVCPRGALFVCGLVVEIRVVRRLLARVVFLFLFRLSRIGLLEHRRR